VDVLGAEDMDDLSSTPHVTADMRDQYWRWHARRCRQLWISHLVDWAFA
jgi:hypothetical protein